MQKLPLDILIIAREQMGQADSCAVIDLLFDAAMRAVSDVDTDDARLNAALNEALHCFYTRLSSGGRGGEGATPAGRMNIGNVHRRQDRR